jgi:hypothetical protein
MVEPGIKPGTSWLVVRSSDHQTTRLVNYEVKERFHHRVKDKRRIVTNGNAHDETISRGREGYKKG